jgi:hypothetical protein
VNVEPGGGEGVAVADRVHPDTQVGELLGHRRRGPQVEPGVGVQRGAQPLGLDVVESARG